MEKIVVADSSALISLLSLDDSNNKLATKLANELLTPTVTVLVPSDIFSETVNVLGKHLKHTVVTKMAKSILKQQELIVQETLLDIHLKALDKFNKLPKSLSYTDCIVMAFADKYETKSVYAFDRHFKTNGYKRIGIDK